MFECVFSSHIYDCVSLLPLRCVVVCNFFFMFSTKLLKELV